MTNYASKLREALQEAVESTQNPGAVAYVGDLNETYFHGAYGFRQITPQREITTLDTIYDLASVTKCMATTTSILLLMEDEMLHLDDPVSHYIPASGFDRFTIRHLLTHTSGLVGWTADYRDTNSATEMIARYAERGIDWTPGSRRRYSDMGFIILGRIVELVAEERLDRFCKQRIFDPLEMNDTMFSPPAERADRCAATEQCGWRNRLIRGEVHDENASALGGVAGHAGLFSIAEDMARYCRGILSGKLLQPDTLDAMTAMGQVPFYPWQGLGWQLDPWSSGFSGYLPSRRAFGHAGWTGTSVWMDRFNGLFAILLGNTCHPSRQGRNTPAFRLAFHKAVEECFYPDRTSVHTGLDRLMYEDFRPLRGNRVALLTHHAAVDSLNRHILDVFALAPDISLRYLYSPEHGIQGQAEAGEHVATQNGDVPVISLYGERTEPSASELAEVDYFVVDLKDIGSRYYTYPATMRNCLRACELAEVPVIILDRPNPIGGNIIEGPIAERTDSLVSWAAVPVRHGLTMGELAHHFSTFGYTEGRINVTVSTIDNWNRDQLFDACDLPWTPPSPNIPTAETALVYVGTCLFEGTNLNEGRGTETPFHLIGAPWLDTESVIEMVRPEDREGCQLTAVEYTPRSLPGRASSPRYQDTLCKGIYIHITDANAFRPFRVAVALLISMRECHGDQVELTRFFDTLSGGPSLREAIEGGQSATCIVESYARPHEVFRESVLRRYT